MPIPKGVPGHSIGVVVEGQSGSDRIGAGTTKTRAIDRPRTGKSQVKGPNNRNAEDSIKATTLSVLGTTIPIPFLEKISLEVLPAPPCRPVPNHSHKPDNCGNAQPMTAYGEKSPDGPLLTSQKIPELFSVFPLPRDGY